MWNPSLTQAVRVWIKDLYICKIWKPEDVVLLFSPGLCDPLDLTSSSKTNATLLRCFITVLHLENYIINGFFNFYFQIIERTENAGWSPVASGRHFWLPPGDADQLQLNNKKNEVVWLRDLTSLKWVPGKKSHGRVQAAVDIMTTSLTECCWSIKIYLTAPYAIA